MTLDLSKFKSLVVIEDPEVIHDNYKRREMARVGSAAHTVVRSEEGRPDFRKVSGGLLNMSATGETLPQVSNDEVKRLAQMRGIQWVDEFFGRAIPYIASDERVDSYGDIVLQNWLFDEFEDNPVLPFSHEWENPPVGNAIDWKVMDDIETPNYRGRALWLLGLFATKDMSDFADNVFRLVKSRILRAGSVGFWAGKVIDVQDEKERAELGLGKWGYILDQNHLLEFSPCTIGANSGALSLLSRAKRSGSLQAKDIDLLREIERRNIVSSTHDEGEWRATDSRYVAAARTLFPSHEFKKHKDMDEPLYIVEKKTGSIHPVNTELKDGVEVVDAEEFRHFRATVEESLEGVVQQLSDIRDLLEDKSADPEHDSNSPSSEGEDEGDISGRMASLLSRIDAMRDSKTA